MDPCTKIYNKDPCPLSPELQLGLNPQPSNCQLHALPYTKSAPAMSPENRSQPHVHGSLYQKPQWGSVCPIAGLTTGFEPATFQLSAVCSTTSSLSPENRSQPHVHGSLNQNLQQGSVSPIAGVTVRFEPDTFQLSAGRSTRSPHRPCHLRTGASHCPRIPVPKNYNKDPYSPSPNVQLGSNQQPSNNQFHALPEVHTVHVA
ncbi:hypothetical protein EGW08_002176 [Elysia chlorotica]|uniref:Uncharacterized protein n=1 Tax=Elysia chlorotica TaxID=188477 RepID=A0A433U8C0_ELYCH|nr:hypothetical protein EGW08_002176 [Elysia chlorotica]